MAKPHISRWGGFWRVAVDRRYPAASLHTAWSDAVEAALYAAGWVLVTAWGESGLRWAPPRTVAFSQVSDPNEWGGDFEQIPRPVRRPASRPSKLVGTLDARSGHIDQEQLRALITDPESKTRQ